MTPTQSRTPASMRDAIRELGLEPKHLCREPWESYYILRRGILPCCYGAKPIAPMDEWATAWNSPALQEIRSYLARGELSPYCEGSLGCPIVQRYQERHPRERARPEPVPGRARWILHRTAEMLRNVVSRVSGRPW